MAHHIDPAEDPDGELDHGTAEQRRQRMRVRYEPILGDAELPTSLRWDAIILSLCVLIRQSAERHRPSPPIRFLEIKDSDGDLTFRTTPGDDYRSDYQKGLIAMAEALSASWPATGLKDEAEGNARHQELMKKHGRIIQRSLECHSGWLGLIAVLCDELQLATDRMGAPQIEALQVKEKFGELRFYVRQSNEYQQGLIQLASAMSRETCEQCGCPGSMWVSGGYFHTACVHHRRPDSITVAMYLREKFPQPQQ
jgi:hypothetical protein